MMRLHTDCASLLAAMCLMWATASQPAAAQGAQNVRCENAVNPRGIVTAHPTLSWGTVSDAMQVQRGYQILVATSEEKLRANAPDLWDTGLVRTDKKSAVYQGKPLQSNQKCYWKIRLWASYYQNGAWSEPATFEMGVLPFHDSDSK